MRRDGKGWEGMGRELADDLCVEKVGSRKPVGCAFIGR